MRHLLIEQMPHFILGNTAQFVGSVGDAFSAICCLQIFRFTSSKPSKSAIASDEKFIRLRTNSFVRYCPKLPAGINEEMLACADRIAEIDQKMQDMYRRIKAAEGK